MKNILFLLLFLPVLAFGQSPFHNDVVRANTLSPARVANALDVSKPLTSSGTDTYTFSVPFTGFTYHTGDIYTLVFGNANTSGTVTANIGGLGALDIKDASGNDLSVGDLKAGGAYKFYNNGTHLRLIGGTGSGGGGATAAGSTGDVQYKSAGGGLQAEAAFTYDSATNLLTVPNITAGSSTSLTDGGTVTITGTKHTLTSDEATITWILSQTSDYQTTDIILNATTTTWTFPANTLCVYEGVASGDNTAVLSGTSGDHYILSIYKDGTNYRVVIKNFGQ